MPGPTGPDPPRCPPSRPPPRPRGRTRRGRDRRSRSRTPGRDRPSRCAPTRRPAHGGWRRCPKSRRARSKRWCRRSTRSTCARRQLRAPAVSEGVTAAAGTRRPPPRPRLQPRGARGKGVRHATRAPSRPSLRAEHHPAHAAGAYRGARLPPCAHPTSCWTKTRPSSPTPSASCAPGSTTTTGPAATGSTNSPGTSTPAWPKAAGSASPSPRSTAAADGGSPTRR